MSTTQPFDTSQPLTSLTRSAEDRLLTVGEAARFLNVTVSWVYEHVRPERQDRLPVVKLGKYLRFDARDLRAYVDAKRADSQQSGRRR